MINFEDVIKLWNTKSVYSDIYFFGKGLILLTKYCNFNTVFWVLPDNENIEKCVVINRYLSKNATYIQIFHFCGREYAGENAKYINATPDHKFTLQIKTKQLLMILPSKQLRYDLKLQTVPLLFHLNSASTKLWHYLCLHIQYNGTHTG